MPTIVPNGGLNESSDEAAPNQLVQAENVWAPNGRVETRPGYVGVASLNGIDEVGAQAAALHGNVIYNGAVVTSVAAINARTSGQSGSELYVGFDSTDMSGFSAIPNTASTDDVIAKVEYWDGSAWQFLPSFNIVGNDIDIETKFVFRDSQNYIFVPPNDWSTSTIASLTGYFLKLTLIASNTSTFTCTFDFGPGGPMDLNCFSTSTQVYFIFRPEFSNDKRYIFGLSKLIRNGVSSHYITYCNTSSIRLDGNVPLDADQPPVREEPATIATVGVFDECFIAYNNFVTRHTPTPSSADLLVAKVDDRDAIVGPGARLDRTIVAQLSAWPQGKYIHFFKGHLWIVEGKNTVRWSAPIPYHKVWPELNYAYVGSEDTLVTGLTHLGEHTVVSTRDSISIFVEAGISEFNLQTYVVKEVATGVGWVAMGSVQEINGRLIFLGEDGLYAFDGTPNVQRISDDPVTGADRLQATIAKISKPKRKFCASAHWKSKSLYLLSFSTGIDSTNDTTVVWDYRKNQFWVWTGIDAQHWLVDETGLDEEKLLFGDSNGFVYEFNVGKTDDGRTIESNFTTARINYMADESVRVGEVTVAADNKTRNLILSILKNDAETGNEQEFSFTDYNEHDWSDFSYASGASTDDNWTVRRRRLDKHEFCEDTEWFQVKVEHSEKNQPLSVHHIKVDLIPIGSR